MVKSAENAKGTPLTEEERLIIKEQAEKGLKIECIKTQIKYQGGG